jgi:serine/threonine protein kinase
MVWQAGQSLFGNRYTIQRQIGDGGFAITYLAKDSKGLVWVVKTLKDEVITRKTDDLDKCLNDFREEALNLSLCRHPYIVKIENVFKHEGWLPCIVMEYI